MMTNIKMGSKYNYLYNGTNFSLISRNDIDLGIGKRKLDNIVKENLSDDLDTVLFRIDSKKIIYYYNENTMKELKVLDFLKEINGEYDYFSIFINIDVKVGQNEFVLLNERYGDLIDFFEENEYINFAINATKVEDNCEEGISIFVCV